MVAITTLKKTADQSSAKLSKSITELTKVVADLQNASNVQTDLLNEIATLETQRAALKVQLDEQERQGMVDLEIRMRESELNAALDILHKQNKSAIDTTELQDLQTQLTTLKADFDNKLRAEVAKSEAMSSARQATALKEQDLQFKATTAESVARVTSLSERNILLEKQIDDYKAQLAAERDARIKEAQARGVPAVTVNSGK